jgi:hypothetical protein
MILKADKIANELQDPPRPGDPLIITPMPDLDELRKSGSAALNMRLGCWFLACRQTQIGLLDIRLVQIRFQKIGPRSVV